MSAALYLIVGLFFGFLTGLVQSFFVDDIKQVKAVALLSLISWGGAVALIDFILFLAVILYPPLPYIVITSVLGFNLLAAVIWTTANITLALFC